MKLYINDADEGWIIDELKRQFIEYTSHSVVDDPKHADVIWLIAPWMWDRLDLKSLHIPTLCTIHHLVPDKIDIGEFANRDIEVCSYHVPNHFTKDQVSKLSRKRVSTIPYWGNFNIYHKEYRDECLARSALGLPQDKFIIGSFQRDTEGHDLKTPKLEKGPDILLEWIKAYAKERDVHILLGGFRRQYIISKLDGAGIDYTYMEKADLTTLLTMYESLDLYISSSRYEGGPQSLLECALTKTPVVSRYVGMADVVLAPNCIRDVDVYYPTEQDIKITEQNAINLDILTLINSYDSLIEYVGKYYAYSIS
jgi:hypothetical protein